MSTSSKMSKAAAAATAWALKLFLLVASVVLIVLGATSRPSADKVFVNEKSFIVERVSSPAALEKGLGGRFRLAKNHGMLFIFEHADAYCFWMKDMHFPLDILWFNDNYQLVYSQVNVSPGSYPELFCPAANALYVLEVNAGQAATIVNLPSVILRLH